MLETLVARIPVLLVILSVALLGHVAFVEVDEPSLLLAAVPPAALTGAYLRAGRGGRRRGGRE